MAKSRLSRWPKNYRPHPTDAHRMEKYVRERKAIRDGVHTRSCVGFTPDELEAMCLMCLEVLEGRAKPT